MSNLLKSKSKSRDPPPTLFHRPSPSASNASLPGLGGGHVTSPSHQQQHHQQQQQPHSTSAFASPHPSRMAGPGPSSTTPNLGLGGGSGVVGGGLNISTLPIPSLRSRESTRATDRTDALWAEMQATLEAVELSGAATASSTTAATSSARVFGPDHERKLDELRAAQIALAQAWARSEADDAIETTGAAGEGGGGGGVSEGRSVVTDAGGAGGGTGVGVGKSTAGTGSARPASSGLGMGGGGGQERPGGGEVEEETEVDILLARKRREANDRYFQRVNQGVLDVVSKLEEVAIAMREVELESKELWGDDNESVSGSAKT